MIWQCIIQFSLWEVSCCVKCYICNLLCSIRAHQVLKRGSRDAKQLMGLFSQVRNLYPRVSIPALCVLFFLFVSLIWSSPVVILLQPAKRPPKSRNQRATRHRSSWMSGGQLQYNPFKMVSTRCYSPPASTSPDLFYSSSNI